MTTASEPASESVSDGAHAAHGPATVVAPGERGATRIADRVVAKIAAQAAREAVGALPKDAAPPHATVVVRPPAAETARSRGTATASVRVRVHLELDYPTDIGARCAAVRRHVTERVGTLVDMEVPEVAVEVERLHPAPGHGADGRTR
ncbi:Asp23/Gls24 family envelope stress response protein [Streptomyces sp. NPDC004752]